MIRQSTQAERNILIINDYPADNNILLYYTTDGTEPQTSDTRKQYAGEELSITGAVTVKAVYFSACGKCVKCKDDKKAECLNGVYGKVGTYRYTVPTIIHTGGGGGGGGRTINKTRKYTKDIFGNEHPTHIGYINGYPDGSVQPNGNITREEITSILYRIVNHDYEKPFIPTGDAFPDVAEIVGRHTILNICRTRELFTDTPIKNLSLQII